MRRLFFSFLITAALATGCVPQQEPLPVDGAVSFRARTSREFTTKTVFSGQKTGTKERIDWLAADTVRVISPDVAAPQPSRCADYRMVPSSNEAEKSYASAHLVAGSRPLYWGDGTHAFYGAWPSPATRSAQRGIALSLEGDGAVFSVILPSAQRADFNAVASGGYYGDMRLAYMTAVATAEPGDEVSMTFYPDVTVFYVTVVNDTGDVMTLREVSLTSSTDALCGNYKVALSSDGTRAYSYLTGTDTWAASPSRSQDNASVGVAFDALEVAAAGRVAVALFALPCDLTGITLKVVTDEGGAMRLPLEDAGAPVVFTGRQKHDINNLGIPEVSYTLEVDRTLLSYDRTGVASAAQEFTVTSSKGIGGSTLPAGWKTVIRTGENSWADLDGNCPDWLAGFPVNSDGVTAVASTYREDVTAQPLVSHESRLRAGKVYDQSGNVYDNSTKAAALDLSKYNFISKRQEALRTTANTYVVSAPGWYKIPMVYGNLIENGSTVAKACKGSRWALGHLDYFKKATDANIYLGINYPWLQEAYLDHCRIHWEKYTHWTGTQAETTARQWSEGADIGVIDGVELNNAEEYMYFHVDANLIRPGSALLATYGDDGDCCWSWMIWITDLDMNLVTLGDNRVLPVNLGWTDDTEGQFYPERRAVIKFVSTEVPGLETDEVTVLQPAFQRVSTSGWQTYYQWGRKDPFSDGVTNVHDDDGALAKSIRHPSNIMYDRSTFLTSGDRYYDWTSANYNNLWDSQNTAWHSPTASLPDHKTVYDPSPRGFCVSPDAAWDGFASASYRAEGDGLFFYTDAAKSDSLFFPASGFMEFADASMAHVGAAGYYWTTHPGESVQRRASYCLRFRKSGGMVAVVPKEYGAVSPFPDDAFRAYAYSVRPVLYNVSAEVSDDIEGSAMQEVMFASEAAGWGWTGDVNLKSGVTVTSGDVSITVRGENTLPVNDPKYIASEGAITLNNKNRLTVSVPAGHQVVQVNLFFADGDGRTSLTASSSPENGGGFQDGSATRDAIWRIDSYSGGTFIPSANSVSFVTGTTGSGRKVYGLSVIYL